MSKELKKIPEVKLFGKWATQGLEAVDPGLKRYISARPYLIPHTSGRHEHQRFKKSLINIVERLVDNMMRPGQSGGSKARAMSIVKNALEAIKAGEIVTCGCNKLGDKVQFWVHNPGYITPHVQSQIFKWSFSTKGKDRGLGTYGMRLLSERFLGGKVAFTSTPTGGTTFTATYPLVLDSQTSIE